MKKKVLDALAKAPLAVKERKVSNEVVEASKRWFSNKLLTSILQQEANMGFSMYQSFVDLETRIQLDKDFKDINYEQFVEFVAQSFGIEYSVS